MILSNQKLLTIKAVAKTLNRRPVTIYKMMHEGKIPFALMGRCYRIPEKDLQDFIQKQLHLDRIKRVYTRLRRRDVLIARATIGNQDEIKEIYRIAKERLRVRCYLCGDLIPKGHRHVDHIIPISKGGHHRPSNLAVACDGCNLKKHAKMPREVGLLL